MPLDEIAGLINEHNNAPEKRLAQRKLAFEITTTVHGREIAESVENVSAILFNPNIDFKTVSENTCEILKNEVPYAESNINFPVSVVNILSMSGACASNGEAKRSIRQGGVSINGIKITDEQQNLNSDDLICGRYLFIRIGRKKFNMFGLIK